MSDSFRSASMGGSSVQESRVQGSRVQEWNSDRPAEPVERDTVLSALLGLTWVEVDDELVVEDQLADRYYRLNRTGAFIFKEATQHRTPEAVAHSLAEQHQVSVDDSLRVVLGYVQLLVDSRILVPEPNRAAGREEVRSINANSTE